MDIRACIKVATRRWPSIVLGIVLGLAAGSVATLTTTPMYEARSQLFVSTRTADDTAQLQQGGMYTQDRVQSYTGIAASRAVTGPVVKKLGLRMSPDALAGRITASAALNTVLIDVTVRDAKPKRAARIADAVADRLATVVQRLETPDDAKSSPVKLGVTQDAATPKEPVSPRPLLNLLAGLALGLFAGVAAALLRETLDTTIKTAEGLGESTEFTVLGAIPNERTSSDNPLVNSAGYSARAEAFRLLRTNLQFALVDREPRVIVVTSALAGEGKTSTSVSLALSLAEAGLKTCLVDADLRRPRVARTLGLIEDAGLTSVLIGAADIKSTMQGADGGKLRVLAAGPIPPNPAELLSSDRIRNVLRELADEYDVVVVDSPPVLPVADTAGLAPLADGVVMVVRAGHTPADRVRAAHASLTGVGAHLLGGVLNRAVLPKSLGYGYGYAPLRQQGKPADGAVKPQRHKAGAR
ncbi:polysaccharide biosynthesis tyrosine autokinase [Streptomyces sp. A7024]|uniref:non-specific protein-tyrosine kinase n=1 Tax=Streptomyces coryli TaxID=1128680 RepID=A0A6G4TZZ1_9ACTN|nr:polysaccharide biosynthesis tyrosine autokinase [Streptomyces coryli]